MSVWCVLASVYVFLPPPPGKYPLGVILNPPPLISGVPPREVCIQYEKIPSPGVNQRRLR